ncbi:AraC family transcriptional regulator [Algoriphagus halophytocola]|uniref:AraC family transcriptional regulator n=1 Tax=Algoriphagus halophytocola TaxID=2991499 RepID=A0ABY6MKK4_9BACT|nr:MULTISPECIES: AraC family transcriptional regulator [unclassified Algoriphagus]UZD23489.1 AraC family transcriptional regulator [Algoriphagus sp. TR-M5]WBL44783.1 AraC family transcriptional regulator [Algoriphagus sp. TR-M9]
MKKPLQKSKIPENKVFVIKELREQYLDKYWHSHEEYQLNVVLKGRGTRYIGDHMKPFKEGDMVLTGPNLPHVWRSDNIYFDVENGLETHDIVIYFPENFLGENAFMKEEYEDIEKLLSRANRGLEITGPTNRQVTKMMKELLDKRGTSRIVGLLQILDLLAHSSDLSPITQLGYKNNYAANEKDKISEILEYVLKNFKDKITLQDVAAMASMSESAFSRYFKSRVNKSFSDFLGDVRISNARKLLHDEDLNVSQVCFESGFPTLSNFNKQFKDRTGKTPLAYKKEYMDTFE